MNAMSSSGPSSAPYGGVRRVAGLAAIMSLLAPGLGQIYNGQPRKAGGFAAAYILWAVIMTTDVGGTPGGFAVFVFLATMVYFAAIIDAFRSARRLGAIRPGPLNRWFVYLAYVVLLFGVDTLTAPYRGIEAFTMPSGSNLPTIRVGEYIVAAGGGSEPVVPEPGDLVIFEVPDDDAALHLKRVVALAGSRVQMKAGRLIVDGAPVPRERIDDFGLAATGVVKIRAVPQYVETLPDGRRYRIIEAADDAGPRDTTDPVTVPEGHVFVLGDNRDSALDSRVDTVGMVPVSRIKRKAAFVLYSKNFGRIGTRLD